MASTPYFYQTHINEIRLVGIKLFKRTLLLIPKWNIAKIPKIMAFIFHLFLKMYSNQNNANL